MTSTEVGPGLLQSAGDPGDRLLRNTSFHTKVTDLPDDVLLIIILMLDPRDMIRYREKSLEKSAK